MILKRAYQFLILGVAGILFSGVINLGLAQQSDTSQTQKRKLEERRVQQPYHSERSANSFLLEESGTYGVPEPKEYYRPPFNGQESLDRAVEAYRKELEDSIANSPLFQLLGKVAPFITNQFEFGFYRIYDLPIVERDHPALYPQTDTEKKENSQ